MPHRLTYLILILCSLLLTSCQKEKCNDILLPQQNLSEESTDYQSWLTPQHLYLRIVSDKNIDMIFPSIL